MYSLMRRPLAVFFTLILGLGLPVLAVRVLASASQQPAFAWPLEHPPGRQTALVGRNSGDRFGAIVVTGDVNGDGTADLLIGAPSVDTPDIGTGEVYVIPGPFSAGETITMPERAALIFQGAPGEQAQIGIYLDSGDMNGDGYDDIVLGSWITKLNYLYLGSPDIQAGSPITVPVESSQMAVTVGPSGGGFSLCDINDDGYQDWFLRDAYYDQGTTVYGIFGSPAITMTHPISLALPGAADLTIQGFDPINISSPTSEDIACADVDGDGHPDLAIGHDASNPYGEVVGAGSVFIIRGDPNIREGEPVTLTLPAQAGAILDGEKGSLKTPGNAFGRGLAAADVNQDGRADLIIGAPGANCCNDTIWRTGKVYLWLGRALNGQRINIASQAEWTVYPDQDRVSIGSVITTGDFDADDATEILLGCPGCMRQTGYPWLSGRGYLLEPLQFSGLITVSAVSRMDILPYGGTRGLGESAGAADLDGDGIDELLIGASGEGYPWEQNHGTVIAIWYPFRQRFYFPNINRKP